jgi:hypothetical protein
MCPPKCLSIFRPLNVGDPPSVPVDRPADVADAQVWSVPERGSTTAVSSNDPTNQEVRIKPRDTPIHRS